MSSVRVSRALRVFEAVCEWPTDGRAKKLNEMCGSDLELRNEVESLLKHDDPRWSALERPCSPFGALDRRSAFEFELPHQFGRYMLLERIGEGSMGVVYRAAQDHPKRQVALKILRPSGGSRAVIRRFEREIATLAKLRHPGIAQIFDAGTESTVAGPCPYLAMELVEGCRLTQFVNDGELTTRERLALFLKICDAVQNAHQSGAIHRDLKPDNILVENTAEGPRPRVLDFGVVSLVDEEGTGATLATSTGQIVGTLAYMAPEQLDGTVDTRVDVYALGVILYELLSGCLPISIKQKELGQALECIRNVEPKPLNHLGCHISRDLGAITSKALAKQPERRYASVGELASDVRRYLRNEPVSARGDLPLYKFRKFARRYRGLLAAGCIVLAALLVGGGAGWYGLLQANRAVGELSDIAAFLVADVAESLDAIVGTREVRRRLLGRLRGQVEALLDRRPADAALLIAHADVLERMSDLEHEEGHHLASLKYREWALAERDRATVNGRVPDAEYLADYAINLVKIGDAHGDCGRPAVALGFYERALQIHERLVIDNPSVRRYLDDLSWSYERLGHYSQRFGRSDEAEEFFVKRLEATQKLALAYPGDAAVLNGLCKAHLMLSRLPGNQQYGHESVRHHEGRALSAARQLVRAAPHQRVYVNNAAGVFLSVCAALVRDGNLKIAEELLDEVSTIVETLSAESESYFHVTLKFEYERLLSRVREREGDFAAALAHARTSLDLVSARDDDSLRLSRFTAHQHCAHIAMQLRDFELAKTYTLQMLADGKNAVDDRVQDGRLLRSLVQGIANPPFFPLADLSTAAVLQERVIAIADGNLACEWLVLSDLYTRLGCPEEAHHAILQAKSVIQEDDACPLHETRNCALAQSIGAMTQFGSLD